METNRNSLFLNEKTMEILTKIEDLRDKNKNIFLLNLWKNYIINKKESYLQTLDDCDQFVNKLERELDNNNNDDDEMHQNNFFIQDLSSDTIVLMYSLMSIVNNRHIEL